MSNIRNKDTKPEITVRRLVRNMGYGYRIHRKDIPGTPDLAFISRKKVIFVHGCFWHHHEGCKFAYTPKTNVEYWKEKFKKNVERDNKVLEDLRNKGWDYLVVWECQLKNIDDLSDMLKDFLEN